MRVMRRLPLGSILNLDEDIVSSTLLACKAGYDKHRRQIPLKPSESAVSSRLDCFELAETAKGGFWDMT